MKKVISLLLAMMLLISTLTVSFSALSVSDVDDEGVPYVQSVIDGVKAWEEENDADADVKRIYFQMPNGSTGPIADEDVMLHHPEELDEEGNVVKEEYDEVVIEAGAKAPTWFNENNILDGKHYAGVYWWGGDANKDGQWVGYRMEIDNEEQGIYYADIPENVAVAIFNNGVDGGTDTSKDIYYQAAQTIDTNIQGAYEGDYDTLPYGSPDNDYFEDCIYVIDPNQVSINAFSQKQTCGANWYVYYGNGCYGEEYGPGGDNNDYPDGTPGWTGNIADVCKNPDHFKNGVHVGAQGGDDPTEAPHVHTPGEAVRENEVAATYKAGGSYDSVVYCTECGEEISREKVTTDPIALDPSKLYFDAASTGWEMGSKNKIAFHIFGGDIENGLAWGAAKSIGSATDGADGLFEIDPVNGKQGYTFTPGVQYKIIFVRTETKNWTNQTYDLLFTTDCFGHVAYCDGTEYENPVDSSKKTLAAFWYGMDAAQVGPVKQISSIGNVVGTCLAEGTTDESLFNDFLTVVDSTTGMTKYQNAYKFVVAAGNKTEQQMLDDIGAALGFEKQDIADALAAAEVESAWDPDASSLPGEVTPPVHEHTPGEPVRENEKPATCTEEGSYDEVIYCTECGEEISRETKTIDKIAHTLTFVAEVPATETATGTKAHYKCDECGKLFSDATGAEEVTAASLVIPMLAHTHTPGEAVRENEIPATCEAEGSYDEVIYCTSCGEEISREHKTIDKTKHTLKRVNGKAATETEDGWESHYRCSVCGKYFADPAGTREVTWEQIVKPKLTPDPTEPPVVITGKLGDVDGDGEITIVDVTIIQRVLAGLKDKTDEINKLGDVDKSGSLESIDATLIQRWLLGLNQDLDIGKDV